MLGDCRLAGRDWQNPPLPFFPLRWCCGAAAPESPAWEGRASVRAQLVGFVSTRRDNVFVLIFLPLPLLLQPRWAGAERVLLGRAALGSPGIAAVEGSCAGIPLGPRGRLTPLGLGSGVRAPQEPLPGLWVLGALQPRACVAVLHPGAIAARGTGSGRSVLSHGDRPETPQGHCSGCLSDSGGGSLASRGFGGALHPGGCQGAPWGSWNTWPNLTYQCVGKQRFQPALRDPRRLNREVRARSETEASVPFPTSLLRCLCSRSPTSPRGLALPNSKAPFPI